MVVIKRVLAAVLVSFCSLSSYAAILGEDRADVMYHSYEGGGMKIDGPAVLIRKKASETVAISAFYYVDTISSASVDVMSTASPYTEERREGQLGVEFLEGKTTLKANIRQSDENDYLARSASFALTHDTFGDLTTIGLGMTVGDDEIKRNGDGDFLEDSRHYSIQASIDQILTSNLIASINVEANADEGYLNNPYRTVRYLDSQSASGVSYQAEVYPETRNSLSVKFNVGYHLPYKAAVFAHYRYFSDSWEIDATDIELSYRQPFFTDFEFDFRVRYYTQTQAEFYADLFPYQDAQNYLARDKELSDFDDLTIGIGVTYTLPDKYSVFDWRSELTLQWDHIQFDYNNFRDPTQQGDVGEEPLYSFSADVVRAFVSVYF